MSSGSDAVHAAKEPSDLRESGAPEPGTGAALASEMLIPRVEHRGAAIFAPKMRCMLSR